MLPWRKLLEVAQDDTGETVLEEHQLLELAEAAKLRRDFTGEAVGHQKQQDGEAPYAEGNDAMTGHIISTTIDGKNGELKQTISYMAERVVGTGSFGIVFQAKCLETGETVAIKKVLQDRRYKNRGLQLMRSINHPNVISLKHCFFSTTSRDELFLNLVMEYVTILPVYFQIMVPRV